MRVKTRVMVHVGYPKCGSTSLQQNFFAANEAIEDLTAATRMDLSKIAPCPYGTHLSGLAALACSNDRVLAAAYEKFKSVLHNDAAERQINLFSCEDVLVRPTSRGTSPAKLFDRLAKVVPEAEIIFFIRPQHEIIRSLYDMYPVIDYADRASGKSVPLAAYVDHLLHEDVTFSDGLMFAKRIEEAQQRFSVENVHVFTFHEVFRTGASIARLASVFDVDEGSVRDALARPAINDFAMHVVRRRMRRLLGRIHGSWFLPRETLVAINTRLSRATKVKRTEMPVDIVERIEAFYAEDNARLAKLLPEIGVF